MWVVTIKNLQIQPKGFNINNNSAYMYPGDWVGKSWWCDICWGLYQINIFCCIWIWTFVGQSISAALQYLIIMLYYFNLSFGYRPKSYCDFDHKSNNQSRSLRKTDLRCILKDIMSALSCSKRRLIRDWVHTHTHTHTHKTLLVSVLCEGETWPPT